MSVSVTVSGLLPPARDEKLVYQLVDSVDESFLKVISRDAERRMLTLPPDHPLLGRPQGGAYPGAPGGAVPRGRHPPGLMPSVPRISVASRTFAGWSRRRSGGRGAVCAGCGPLGSRADTSAGTPSWARSDVRRPQPGPNRYCPAAAGARRPVAALLPGRAPGARRRRLTVVALGRAVLARPALLPRLRAGEDGLAVHPRLAVLVRRGPGDGRHLLNAVRLGPADDATAVTAAQLRESSKGSSRRASGSPGIRARKPVRSRHSRSAPSSRPAEPVAGDGRAHGQGLGSRCRTSPGWSS